MAFALFFIIQGVADESKTIYFHQLHSCLYLAQELSKGRPRYTPIETKCELVWIPLDTKVIR